MKRVLSMVSASVLALCVLTQPSAQAKQLCDQIQQYTDRQSQLTNCGNFCWQTVIIYGTHYVCGSGPFTCTSTQTATYNVSTATYSCINGACRINDRVHVTSVASDQCGS